MGRSLGISGPWAWMFAALFGISIVLRLTFLEAIPGSPYIDEASAAANAMCLAEQGTSATGDRWPLFFEVLVGNWEPPMIIYPSALIAMLGDSSIGTFRIFAALVVIATIAGVFVVGRELAGPRVAVFAALLASLAPWSFQAGRLFWKCPLAPMFVVWGVYLLLLAFRTRSLAIVTTRVNFESSTQPI